MAARTVWAEFLRGRFCLPPRRSAGRGSGQWRFQGLGHVDRAAVAGRLWRRGVERCRDAVLLPGCRDLAGRRNPGALAHGCAPVSRSGGLLGGAGSGCGLAAGRSAETLRWAVLCGGTARRAGTPLNRHHCDFPGCRLLTLHFPISAPLAFFLAVWPAPIRTISL